MEWNRIHSQTPEAFSMVFLARAQTHSEPDWNAAGDRLSSQRLPQRIFYAVGHGDVVGQYRNLLEGREPPFQLGMSFSMQFLDACDEAGAVAHLVSSHSRRDSLPVGRHRVENLPKSSLYERGGLLHHLGAALYGLNLVAQAVRERATLVIADSGTTNWVVLSLLSFFRIPVIAVLHNALWPMGFPPTRRRDRFLRQLDGWFFRHVAAATVCVSPECERQVRRVAGTPKGPVLQCRPQYREDFLSRVPPPERTARPFCVLFLGRIEAYKGVFFILSLAERLEREQPGRFAWRIAGAGSASDELARRVEERNLEGIVRLDGMLPNEESALETLGWAHAMIVPSTTQFVEGLAMTAIESILVGRPVVVSSVMPAMEVLGRAAIQAESGNLDSFAGIFRKLTQDAEYYEECRLAATAAQAQFYDRSQGLGAVLMRAAAALR
jgi:glycosyltransferase involved in cell wall biosynthesis